MKCKICDNKIEETFLEKIKGTVVKIKKGDSNELCYVCPECQKKHKNLKETIGKNQD